MAGICRATWPLDTDVDGEHRYLEGTYTLTPESGGSQGTPVEVIVDYDPDPTAIIDNRHSAGLMSAYQAVEQVIVRMYPFAHASAGILYPELTTPVDPAAASELLSRLQRELSDEQVRVLNEDSFPSPETQRTATDSKVGSAGRSARSGSASASAFCMPSFCTLESDHFILDYVSTDWGPSTMNDQLQAFESAWRVYHDMGFWMPLLKTRVQYYRTPFPGFPTGGFSPAIFPITINEPDSDGLTPGLAQHEFFHKVEWEHGALYDNWFVESAANWAAGHAAHDDHDASAPVLDQDAQRWYARDVTTYVHDPNQNYVPPFALGGGPSYNAFPLFFYAEQRSDRGHPMAQMLKFMGFGMTGAMALETSMKLYGQSLDSFLYNFHWATYTLDYSQGYGFSEPYASDWRKALTALPVVTDAYQFEDATDSFSGSTSVVDTGTVFLEFTKPTGSSTAKVQVDFQDVATWNRIGFARSRPPHGGHQLCDVPTNVDGTGSIVVQLTSLCPTLTVSVYEKGSNCRDVCRGVDDPVQWTAYIRPPQ